MGCSPHAHPNRKSKHTNENPKKQFSSQAVVASRHDEPLHIFGLVVHFKATLVMVFSVAYYLESYKAITCYYRCHF